MANVSTNKLDYAPGEVVTITLVDITIGSTFTFHITDSPADPGDDGVANSYPTFSVVDGGAGDLDGIANGKIVTEWTVPTDGSPNNATLDLTATDGTTTLTTQFTDASPSITLNQWETKSNSNINNGNGQWNNGQANFNQTLYFEGEFVPYSVDLGNLTAGSNYGLRINLDFYQANTDSGGFLQLGTYNTDIPLTPTDNDNFGTPSPAGLDSDFTITALDGRANNAFSFYTANADVLSVTYSLSANGLTRYADVVFQAKSSTQNSELYWGQQLATPNQVASPADATPLNGTDGAAGFTGG